MGRALALPLNIKMQTQIILLEKNIDLLIQNIDLVHSYGFLTLCILTYVWFISILYSFIDKRLFQ